MSHPNLQNEDPILLKITTRDDEVEDLKLIGKTRS